MLVYVYVWSVIRSYFFLLAFLWFFFQRIEVRVYIDITIAVSLSSLEAYFKLPWLDKMTHIPS